MDKFGGEVFDEDGYPTDGFLDHVENWHFSRGHSALLDFAMTGHIYPTFWKKSEPENGKIKWEISTGGWSGNESIIHALQSNVIFWAMCWVQSRRGGHFIFETLEGA